jgi:hypothetical protein
MNSLDTDIATRDTGAAPPQHDAPLSNRRPDSRHWLLWSTSTAAILLGFAAFMLWGLNGSVTLFDLIAAYCF